MLRSLKLSLTISVTWIPFICYFTKKHIMETFKAHCDELRRHWNSILYMFLLKTFFHCLFSFIFVTFSLIHWPLGPAPSSVSWWRSCFDCSGRVYETVCILCGLLSCDRNLINKCYSWRWFWKPNGLGSLYSPNVFCYAVYILSV